MFAKYRIRYAFYPPCWDDAYLRKSVQHWESQGFACRVEAEDKIVGERGSFGGNLWSYNMKKLICSLDLCHKSDGLVVSVLTLNGLFQDVTDANLDDFKMEQILFRRFLLDLPEPDFLDEYRKVRTKCSLLWTFFLFTAGRELPEDMSRRIEELCKGGEVPSVEKIAEPSPRGDVLKPAPRGSRYEAPLSGGRTRVTTPFTSRNRVLCK